MINWIESTFTTTRPAMKGVDWGSLYKDFGNADLDADEIEQETVRLILDDDGATESGDIPVHSDSRGEAPEHTRLFSQHETKGL